MVLPFLLCCCSKKNLSFSGIIIWTISDEINYDLLTSTTYFDLISKYPDSIIFDFKDCVYFNIEDHTLKFKNNNWEMEYLKKYIKGYESGKGNIYFSIVLDNKIYTNGLCRIFNISESFYPLDTSGTLYLLYCKETKLFKLSYDINDDGNFEDYLSSPELFPFILDYKPIEKELETIKKIR